MFLFMLLLMLLLDEEEKEESAAEAGSCAVNFGASTIEEEVTVKDRGRAVVEDWISRSNRGSHRLSMTAERQRVKLAAG